MIFFSVINISYRNILKSVMPKPHRALCGVSTLKIVSTISNGRGHTYVRHYGRYVRDVRCVGRCLILGYIVTNVADDALENRQFKCSMGSAVSISVAVLKIYIMSCVEQIYGRIS